MVEKSRMSIKKVSITKPKDHTQVVQMFEVNGTLDKKTVITGNSIDILSAETFLALMELSHQELIEWADDYLYDFTEEDYPFSLTIIIALKPMGKGDSSLYYISAEIDPVEWNKPYSMADMYICYKDACKNIRGVDVVEDFYGSDKINISFSCTIRSKKTPLKKYYQLTLQALHTAHAAVQLQLEKPPQEGLTSVFCFPPEIRVACNQYLLYFGQFLEDLGIPADTTIKEEMNRVLFTIKPKNREQALEVIYETLAVYLSAPGMDLADYRQDSTIALTQWKANMLHLKSQLGLTRALLQAKDATIQSMELTTYLLQSQLCAREPESSGKEPDPGTKEDILGGAASITKLKLKGITINLPYILRRLRRK